MADESSTPVDVPGDEGQVPTELAGSEIEVPEELKGNVFITKLSQLYGWGRKNSLWPLFFGVACCAFEFMAAAAARFDTGRFGMDLARASPRQADVIIISGTVTKKMAPKIMTLWNQMAEPKYAISMGVCATGGGPFKEGYHVVSGIDQFLPIDVYSPGCPPTPEALIDAYMAVHEKVQNEQLNKVRWYKKHPIPATPVPLLGGPDLIDPRHIDAIAAAATEAASAPVPEPDGQDPVAEAAKDKGVDTVGSGATEQGTDSP